MLVKHTKFPGNGIVKRIDRETYSIPMAIVHFPLMGLKGEVICRPASEFILIHSNRQLD